MRLDDRAANGTRADGRQLGQLRSSLPNPTPIGISAQQTPNAQLSIDEYGTNITYL